MEDPRGEQVGARLLPALGTWLRRAGRRVAYGLPLRLGRSPRHGATRPTREVGPLAAFSRYNRAYFQRWVLIGVLIGIGAGISMTVFVNAIELCTHAFLGLIAGDTPPRPSGEGATIYIAPARAWLLPVATTLGGLITGIIVYTLAPETARGGTDAAIRAFHEQRGEIRQRVPAVKLVASAITIGSGGSAGREGAAAQIMAGIGAMVGGLLHLDNHDRRIAVVAGIGAGIGTVFRAPFAGALFSAEVLYKRDFEADALFPTFIASVVGYAIYGAAEGWTPVFGLHTNFVFHDPRSLAGFLVLGISAGFIGLLFHWVMHASDNVFDRLPLTVLIKPALGGLLVGVIGVFLPEALGMGYGYVQFGVDGNFTTIGGITLGILVFAKIATTSLTIGSGGSGGDVAPAIVAGGFLGGALWTGLHHIVPALVVGIQPGAFVIVGMAAFFGGISKTPLAMILMVAEMTGQLSLTVPAILATMVAYLITGDTSIYAQQVPTRLESPAHKNDYALPLLQSLSVRHALTAGLSGALAMATLDTPADKLAKLFRDRHVASILILDSTRLAGVVTATDLARIEPERMEVTQARQVMSRALVRAYADESLYTAWLRMSRRNLRQLPVVDRAEPTRVVGVVTTDAIAKLLRLPTANQSASQSTARAPVPAAPSSTTAGIGQSDAILAAATDVASEDDQQEVEEERVNAPEAGAAALEKMLAEARQESATGQESARNGAGRNTSVVQVMRDNPGRDSGNRESRDPFTMLRVKDAMLKAPRTIGEAEPVAYARRLLDERGNSLLVVDEAGRLVGIVTRSDLKRRGDQERAKQLSIGDVAVRNLVTAAPNETLRVAVHRMNRLGLRQLPVVASDQPAAPLGLLRRADILAAYEQVAGTMTASPARAERA